MPITATDRHMHAPRIGIAAFTALLRAAGSPVDDPGACYTQVFSLAVDPLFALAIFWHESTFATNPQSVNARYGNHNPGNVRNPPPSGPQIQTDRGPFLTFANWTAGFAGLAVHLASPLYHDLTIGEVFAKWAPASDGNDPARYTAGVLDYMNQHADTGGTPVKPPYDRTHFSADYGPDRAVGDIKWFIVHDTEGSFPGDEAVLTSPAAPVESATFLIGRTPQQGCVYIVPLDKTPWSCANQSVDEQGISVELSRNPRLGETHYTAYQIAKLAEVFNWCVAQGAPIPAVYLGRDNMSDYGPEPDHNGIIGHQDVPDPNNGHLYGGEDHHTDPGPTFPWNDFLAAIKGGPGPTDTRLTDGHALGAGFTDYIAALDALPNNVRLRDWGLCTSDEYGGYLCSPVGGGRFAVASVVIANFERGRLIWDKGATAAPWDIRRPMANELCGPADQPDVNAVLSNPNARVN